MAYLKSVEISIDQETGIRYRKWLSKDSYCVVFLIHGLGAHSARWQSLGEYFIQKNISCYGIELKGFGETNEKEGHIKSFDVYYKDIEFLLNIIKKKHGKEKVFLLGESLGGLIAVLMSERNPNLFSGLICFAPAFRGTLKFKFWEYAAMTAALFYNPSKQFNMPFNSSMCTRDNEYSRQMDKDVREVRVASAQFLMNTVRGQIEAVRHIKKIMRPVLFLLSGNDQIVDNRVTQKIFSQMTIEDKKLIEYPQMYHALSVDLDREKVFADILEWIQAH